MDDNHTNIINIRILSHYYLESRVKEQMILKFRIEIAIMDDNHKYTNYPIIIWNREQKGR